MKEFYYIFNNIYLKDIIKNPSMFEYIKSTIYSLSGKKITFTYKEIDDLVNKGYNKLNIEELGCLLFQERL